MISAQDKQAILNGAYAITNNGTQARLLFTHLLMKIDFHTYFCKRTEF